MLDEYYRDPTPEELEHFREEVAQEYAEIGLQALAARAKRDTWVNTARGDQLPPKEAYGTWMLLGGRGSGKTRAGAEETWWPAANEPQRIAVIGPTNNDVRKTCFEGESGLLAVIPKELIKNYNRTSLELWLHNDTYMVGYSSEEPERLRGPQHHRAWCDELAAWRYPDDTWDMMQFGLRLGSDPTVIVTTTPKPIKLVKDLLAEPDTKVMRVSTFANAANLPKKYLDKLKRKYEGTRLGRQELYAELLDDNPWALFKREMIERTRVKKVPVEIVRTVVAIDPPVSTGGDADECGTIVACRGSDGHCYILHDGSTQGLSPDGWGAEAARLYRAYEADRVIGEVNNGGDLIESVIRMVDPDLSYKAVRATRGKVRRAEPVAALYEQGRVHHVGQFGSLEDQMFEFTSDFDTDKMGYSPDRVDALVWAVTELMLDDVQDMPRVRVL